MCVTSTSDGWPACVCSLSLLNLFKHLKVVVEKVQWKCQLLCVCVVRVSVCTCCVSGHYRAAVAETHYHGFSLLLGVTSRNE